MLSWSSLLSWLFSLLPLRCVDKRPCSFALSTQDAQCDAKQMEPACVNGSVHIARTQHQRVCFGICMRASSVDEALQKQSNLPLPGIFQNWRLSPELVLWLWTWSSCWSCRSRSLQRADPSPWSRLHRSATVHVASSI